ncbi:zinc finger protein 36-like [Phragmites australis]|uniref:zinc finger protein 36-like n=1 Tax=Phragmites australis TaxID=29695 RepID=UPI002D77335B|nr:zinc finger protein 36-like [Phragmites australis]
MELDALDVSSKPHVPPPPQPMDSWASGGRRSKRHAGSTGGSANQSEEEYLALCLLMLSRGVRGVAEDGRGVARSTGAATTAAAKASQGYECSVCGKVYASYQALGGHKTSHRKQSEPSQPAQAAAPASPGDEASGGSAQEEKVHRCSLCLRTFPSGQALGGHKRLHYEGSAAVAADGVKDKKPVKAKASVATATEVLRDFDLNLPAAAAATVAVVTREEDESAPSEAKRVRMLLVV